MTVSAVITKALLDCTGGTQYSFSFPIIAASDLTVIRRAADGSESTLSLTTHYTLSAAPWDNGGTVTTVATYSDGKLLLKRVMPLTQGTHYTTGGMFPAAAHEAALDKLTLVAQQNAEAIARAPRLPDSSALSPTLAEPIAGAPIGWNDAATGLVNNPTGITTHVNAASASAAAALASEQAADVSEALAADWASKTSAAVAGGEWSAKAHALGGTGGPEGGNAKDWAIKSDGYVIGSDHSAQSWAIGGTGDGQPAAGDAKSWASNVSSTVDGTGYSSKEYAQGSQSATGGSSKNWASQTGGNVSGGSDYSSKEWAIGTAGRGSSGKGSAKEWAVYTGGTVDDASYSAKEYAQGSQAGAGGSAKEWASKAEDSAVPGGGGEYSAKHYAAKAAASAANHPPYVSGGGSADAYTATPATAWTSYAAGNWIRVKIPATSDNTGAATLNVSGLGTQSIKLVSGGDPAAGMIKSGAVHLFVHDGTHFQVMNPTVSSGGLQSIWIPAAAMTPRTTNGAASGSVETTTHKVMLSTLDFDASTLEYAQATVRMPKSWDEGTVTAIFVWSHASTSTNFGVVWGGQGVALSDDDAGDAAFGTAQTVIDTGGTTNDLYQSAATSAITLGGSPAEGDAVIFQFYRNASDGSDTLAIDARLHGVLLNYTTNANSDA
ncbi:MAG: hypothetical protein HQL51_10125 [Magnetococcales bacterium]|nr:hypothetical protein [Magnetococcales bacterium]